VNVRTEGILFDLDGVLYNGPEPIAGAAAAVSWVRERRIPHLFVTNTTSQTRQGLAAKLAAFGIDAGPGQIWTPAAAARGWLLSQNPSPAALFAPAAIRPEFEPVELLPETAESGAAAVVVGDLGEAWTYGVLNRAFRLLYADSNCRLAALGMTRYWQSPSGVSLDVAPFVAALQHATGREPTVLGKPARPFFEAAAGRLGLPPSALAMIGDDIRADVGGAQAAGLLGVLVRTGKFRPEDLAGDVEPNFVLDSAAALPEAWPFR
jgi:phospholysine phosphohistidine inorganic pyrophosphate phosphatase